MPTTLSVMQHLRQELQHLTVYKYHTGRHHGSHRVSVRTEVCSKSYWNSDEGNFEPGTESRKLSGNGRDSYILKVCICVCVEGERINETGKKSENVTKWYWSIPLGPVAASTYSQPFILVDSTSMESTNLRLNKLKKKFVNCICTKHIWNFFLFIISYAIQYSNCLHAFTLS